LCALEEEDVDFENARLKVTKTLVWKQNGITFIEPPKIKKARREISIDETTLMLLKKVIIHNKKRDLRASGPKWLFYRYKKTKKAPLILNRYNSKLRKIADLVDAHQLTIQEA
jgi:integrase